MTRPAARLPVVIVGTTNVSPEGTQLQPLDGHELDGVDHVVGHDDELGAGLKKLIGGLDTLGSMADPAEDESE